jgi:hypothetical protein
MSNLIIWDIETVPDLKGFAAANGHDGRVDDEIRAAMGDKFPKHIYHSIICIGALIAHREDNRWTVTALGAPHAGERSEKALISSFVDRIAELSPQLVTSTDRRLTCPSFDIGHWSMVSRPRSVIPAVFQPVHGSISATCWRRTTRNAGQASRPMPGHGLAISVKQCVKRVSG